MIYIIWYDMLCYDIWYVVMWYNVKWYDVIRYDIIRYVMIYDMLWHDMIWYDMIWYDMIWYDMIWYDMIWYDTFVNCNWVASRWQQYSTHLQTHNTQNNTKIVLEECEPCLIFAGFYPGICLGTDEKARKTLSQGSRRVPADMMKIHNHAIRIYRRSNKNT